MTRTKWFISLLFVVLVVGGLWFAFRDRSSENKGSTESPAQTSRISVRTQSVQELASRETGERLPAVIIPENETPILAETRGTITSAPFEVGASVSVGTMLATITDPVSSVTSKSGLRSEALRQAEIEASLARKAYKEAKRLAEKNTTKESYADRDLAKLRLESAEIALTNARNGAIVRATLAGIVSEKPIGIGSSVSPDTVIARIASGGAPKVRFHVSDAAHRNLKKGDPITVILRENSTETAEIASIASRADSKTAKFSVEARLPNKGIPAGSIATVIIRTAWKEGGLGQSAALPLSSITTNQEGSFFFIADGDIARKVPITSMSVSGESARVSADVSEDARIIVESMGALEDGSTIERRD